MASVSLSVDPGRFEEIRRVLAHIPGGAEKAVMRGLNRALEGARTEALKDIRDRYTISPDIVKASMHILKASPGRLVATLVSRGSGIPVSLFKTSDPVSQKGIPVKLRANATSEIKRGQSRQWSHGFLARMRGRTGFFMRLKGNRIKEVTSLSVPQMLGVDVILTEVLNVAGERLDREIDHQVKFLLEGGGR